MSSRLSILMVTQPSDGGVFEHVSRLAARMTERGHTVTLCGPLAGAGGTLGSAVEQLDLSRAVSPVADARAAAGLVRVVRRVRPDLIHAHSSKAGAVARAARAAFPGAPVIYTPHGFAFAGFFESESERRVYRMIERALSPLATRTLCVCEAEGRLARSVGPAGRVRVVHNGIDAPPAGDAAAELAELQARGPVVGALALLRPGKGLETLIDAMPAVLERHPTATLAVAGEGDGRAQLEARVAALGIADRVRLIGQTPGPGPLLRGCNVFCSPSWAESFPYSLLEAMWLDLPIVSTDVGGCPEAIEDGVTGLLVPPRDQRALARALIRMLDDPVAAIAMGERAGQIARSRFTSDRMVEGTLRVYGEVVDG